MPLSRSDPIQRLRLERFFPAGAKRVPISSPASRRENKSGIRPSATSIISPVSVTICAACNFESIPPRPSADFSSRTCLRTSSTLPAIRTGLPSESSTPSTTVSSTSRSAQGVRHHGREDVVVAEGYFFQLGGAHGVVLVDDRDSPQLVHGQDGVPQIQESRPIVDILAGEEELGDVQFVGFKRVGPDVHEPPLPDRRHRLQCRQIGGALGQTQFAQSRPDRPGTDDGHAQSASADFRQLRRDGGDERRVQPPVFVAEQLGAQLDDDGTDAGKIFGAIGHARKYTPKLA